MTKRSLVLLALCVWPVAVQGDNYDLLLRRYEQQIRSQETQLRSLKVNLAEKERSARRWQDRAEAAKTRWSGARRAMKQAQEMLQRVREKWTRAHTLAEAAEWSAQERTQFTEAANRHIAILMNDLYRGRLTGEAGDPVHAATEEQIVGQLANLSRAAMGEAQAARQQEHALRLEEARWQNAQRAHQREVDAARAEQESHFKRWQTAEKRRRHLEEEKIQMEQSEQALRVMLQSLYARRDQTAAAKQQYLVDRRGVSALRGTLPWPVTGEVVQNFGKQYSKDLQQLVISNGIKIEGHAGQPVRVIQAGKVLFADTFRQYGPLVIVEHRGGLTSVYGSLGRTRVKEGQSLGALDPVGELGEGGAFYFELRHDEEPVNPLVWLTPRN